MCNFFVKLREKGFAIENYKSLNYGGEDRSRTCITLRSVVFKTTALPLCDLSALKRRIENIAQNSFLTTVKLIRRRGRGCFKLFSQFAFYVFETFDSRNLDFDKALRLTTMCVGKAILSVPLLSASP